jgi:hypothetical protein
MTLKTRVLTIRWVSFQVSFPASKEVLNFLPLWWMLEQGHPWMRPQTLPGYCEVHEAAFEGLKCPVGYPVQHSDAR